jgi:hypothetical protein
MQVSRSIRKIFLVKHKKIHILLNMKQMFFKTVKSNGRSVFARGSLCRTYKVGKRYRFRKEFPAHVFSGILNRDGSLNGEYTYDERPELIRGNRVLICYGEVVKKQVPCLDVSLDCWDLSGNSDNWVTRERETCADFVVIGELALPIRYCGIRPVELDNDYPTKIILPGQFKKKN